MPLPSLGAEDIVFWGFLSLRASHNFVHTIFCKLLGEFYQVYHFGALGDKYELIRL